ncbi:hypothetical protein YN1_4390 [Nanoarchaeota archaeon]
MSFDKYIMIKKIIKYFLIILTILMLLKFIYPTRNPLAVYCTYGGGEFYYNSSGQYCIVDGHVFNAIDYYNNLVPSQYSFCAHYNLTPVIKTIEVGNYTINASYCEYPNGTLISPISLIPQSAYVDFIIENTTTLNITTNTNQVTTKKSNYYEYIYIAIGVIVGAIVIYIILR